MEQVSMIGIDLAKNSFQLHGARADGSVAFRRKLSRAKLLGFVAAQPHCTVAMEACGGAHHWGREIGSLGHGVRLVPPVYVKPYVKRQKNDAADAEAICEAASRPTMHFVAVKTEDRQARAMLFRTRDLLVRQRTQTINALRGHLAEFGVVAPKGPVHVRRLALAIGDPATDLPEAVRELGGLLLGPLGSPVNLLIREALKKAGLGMSDVKYSEKFKSPSAWIAAFKNKAIDVQAAVEPIVTMLEAQGLARRWKSYKDAVPWFQETYFAASPKFLKEHPDAAKKFLTAFLQGAKDVHATGGKWTPALLDTLAKWSKLPRKILERIPGPAYAGYFGSIDRAAIDRQQAIWLKHGAVKKKVDVNAIIDTSYLDAARKMAGVK